MSFVESKNTIEREWNITLTAGDKLEIFINGAPVPNWEQTLATDQKAIGRLSIELADTGTFGGP